MHQRLNTTQEAMFHEITRRSLRECLVPLDEWLVSFVDAETDGPFQFVPNIDPHAAGHGHWILPYHFGAPIYRIVLNELRREGAANRIAITQPIIDRWAKMLDERFSYCLQHTLTDETVGELDNNYDVGVLIHQGSGIIVPFEYTHITTVEFTRIPVSTYWILTSSFPDSVMRSLGLTENEYKNLLRSFRREANGVQTTFRFFYDTPGGDRFTTEEYIDSTTGNALVTPELANMSIAYMQSMFQAHAKVISIP